MSGVQWFWERDTAVLEKKGSPRVSFQCDICQRKFARKATLARHQSNDHGDSLHVPAASSLRREITSAESVIMSICIVFKSECSSSCIFARYDIKGNYHQKWSVFNSLQDGNLKYFLFCDFNCSKLNVTTPQLNRADSIFVLPNNSQCKKILDS